MIRSDQIRSDQSTVVRTEASEKKYSKTSLQVSPCRILRFSSFFFPHACMHSLISSSYLISTLTKLTLFFMLLPVSPSYAGFDLEQFEGLLIYHTCHKNKKNSTFLILLRTLFATILLLRRKGQPIPKSAWKARLLPFPLCMPGPPGLLSVHRFVVCFFFDVVSSSISSRFTNLPTKR